MNKPNLCMLMILDGWGIAPDGDSNAVSLANTKNLIGLHKTYPHARLSCSGESVGLPEGVMGNSEVGHLNIGAGRIVYQDLLRIDISIRDGSFYSNPAFFKIMDTVVKNQSTLHLIGLVSDGGVHSHLRHLFSLLELAKKRGVPKTVLHALMDGRDTPPTSGAGFLDQVQKKMNELNYGAIASICGRYFAMDRDNRWDRVEKAFRLLTRGEGIKDVDPVRAIKAAYERNETDEFIKPILLETSGSPSATMKNEDGVLFFNFRADRAREITSSLTDPEFDKFNREGFVPLSNYLCMTLYGEHFKLPMAYPQMRLKAILGETVSKRNFKQFRIAETEKYAHVTYFFNGGEETPFPLEERLLIPSPRDIPTYDYKPSMSAKEVTDAAIKRIRSNQDAMIVLNFANMDMVGHTGILEAAVEACRTVDECVGRIVPEVLAVDGSLLITADHGNSEKMREADGTPHTAHTLNQVRFILVDEKRRNSVLREEGILADIAPTMLEIMGIEKPVEMTGQSLIK